MSIKEIGMNVITSTGRFLNQEPVKEGVKKIAGSLTLAFGLLELLELYDIARGRPVSSEIYEYKDWISVSNKVIIVSAKISLILSAGVSRPGVFIISSLMGSVFSAEKLTKVFGTNTIFAVNPWHPRHIVSIAAVILALPAVAQSVYRFCVSAYPRPNRGSSFISDAKIKAMAFFNTLTSRPTLHIGNWIFRSI